MAYKMKDDSASAAGSIISPEGNCANKKEGQKNIFGKERTEKDVFLVNSFRRCIIILTVFPRKVLQGERS